MDLVLRLRLPDPSAHDRRPTGAEGEPDNKKIAYLVDWKAKLARPAPQTALLRAREAGRVC